MKSVVLINREFDSFQEIVEMASGWDADFRQLTREDFKPHVFQAKTDLLLLSNVQFGCVVDQRGATPPGMRTFALPNPECPEFNWFGQKINQNDLLIFPVHGELDAFTRTGFNVMTFSIPESYLLERFKRDTTFSQKKLPTGAMIKPLPAVNAFSLRRLLNQLVHLLENDSLIPDYDMHINIIQSELLEQLLTILNKSPADLANMNIKRVKKLKALTHYIDTHITEAITINDLCQQVKSSERTIQNLFKKELGILPKAYISGQKLYRAHQTLWRNQRSNLKIIQIANEAGIWHMGQFAADYKKMFDELPSETLKPDDHV